MITIEKTYGVRGVEDDVTLLRLQELIALSVRQYGWVGKAVIDTEKITYYKFGLKLGYSRFAANGLVVNECGIIRNVGFIIPEVQDRQILTDIYKLFGIRCPF
jgi:hypothetical protein